MLGETMEIMENAGWILNNKYSSENSYYYERGDEYLIINFGKRRIETNCDTLSFALLEIIRKIVIENAIY